MTEGTISEEHWRNDLSARIHFEIAWTWRLVYINYAILENKSAKSQS